MVKAILTVGSTEFTPLVLSFLSQAVQTALVSQGITSILAQVGSSTLPDGWIVGSNVGNGISVDVKRFMSGLEEEVGSAELVVSHAGAGSILSFLRPSGAVVPTKRSLILVPNTTLMDSHQADLADEFLASGWADVCSPDELESTILSLDMLTRTKLGDSPYPPFNSRGLSSILDSTAGFKSR